MDIIHLCTEYNGLQGWNIEMGENGGTRKGNGGLYQMDFFI